MRVYNELTLVPAQPRAVAIGTFDGVHIGHRAVIEAAIDAARHRRISACVLTFQHHPLSVVDPDRVPRLLTPLAAKIELIDELGADELVVLPFDAVLAALRPVDFCSTILRDGLHAQVVAVGANFTFGEAGKGRAATLVACGRGSGFETEVVPLVKAGGKPISSSRIRRLLQAGRLGEVRAILGRPPRASGTVVHGFERGRRLGFPTANVEAATGTMFPGRGVYAARAFVDDVWYRAAVNVGHNPTFLHRGDEIGIVHVEAFLLDFEGDVYDRPIRLDFLRKVRDEMAFEYVDDLVARMTSDVGAVRDLADPAFVEVGL